MRKNNGSMDLFSRAQNAAPDEVIFTIHASLPRRIAGVGALLLVGAAMLWSGYKNFSATGGDLILLVIALICVFFAWRFWLSSGAGLELTPAKLRDTRRRQVVRIDGIASVHREAFGFLKPTNGFVIVTKKRMPAAFLPGIWWRFGNRIGVGGLTNSGEGKAMADLLKEMLRKL